MGRQQPRRALRARGCRSAAAGQTTSGKLLCTCGGHARIGLWLEQQQRNANCRLISDNLLLPGCAAPLYVSLRSAFNNKAWGPQANLLARALNAHAFQANFEKIRDAHRPSTFELTDDIRLPSTVLGEKRKLRAARGSGITATTFIFEGLYYYSDQSPSRAPRAATRAACSARRRVRASTWLGEASYYIFTGLARSSPNGCSTCSQRMRQMNPWISLHPLVTVDL